MKIVLTYGTFDLMHYGHINLLKRAKGLGDYLIVGVSSDEFNILKGKKSYHNYENRKKIVEAIKYVDLVIKEENWEQKKSDILKHNVDIFTIGDDWKNKFNDFTDLCDVIYLQRTDGISTSKIKQDLSLDKENDEV